MHGARLVVTNGDIPEGPTVPSNRKQINVRLDEETEAELPELRERMSKTIGLELSYSDLFRLGVAELKKKYTPEKSEKKTRS